MLRLVLAWRMSHTRSSADEAATVSPDHGPEWLESAVRWPAEPSLDASEYPAVPLKTMAARLSEATRDASAD